MTLSLKQLRYFDAVARLGHFGRAAEACAVTQPALSMQIRELEDALGAQLLERRKSGAQLTPLGSAIAERVRSILRDVDDLTDTARAHDAVLFGALRLGVIPSVAPYLLPPLLPRLREDYPDLALDLRETQTATLIQRLKDGTLDVALLALPADGPELEEMALFEDRFLLALPKDRRLPKRVRATPELIQNDRLLLLEEGHCMRDQALAVCGLREVGGFDTFGASSLSTIVQMVANGMGLTLLPEMSLPVEAARNDIRLLEFAAPEPNRTIGLAWRRSNPRVKDFVALGQAILASRPQAAKSGAKSAKPKRPRSA